MRLEQLEEAALLGHERLEPAQHRYPRRPLVARPQQSTIGDAGKARRVAKRADDRLQLRLVDRRDGVGEAEPLP